MQIEGPVGIFGLNETINQWVPKKQSGQFGMGRRNCAHLKPEVQVRTGSSLAVCLAACPSFPPVSSHVLAALLLLQGYVSRLVRVL
jgi:hypothetical protein